MIHFDHSLMNPKTRKKKEKHRVRNHQTVDWRFAEVEENAFDHNIYFFLTPGFNCSMIVVDYLVSIIDGTSGESACSIVHTEMGSSLN